MANYSRPAYRVFVCPSLQQANGQDDQRRREEEGTDSCHGRSHRAPVLLPAREMEEEAARLGNYPHEQEQARQPLNPGRIPGPVEVEEVDEGQDQQNPGVGVASSEELLSELPELAASGEEPEQSPASVLYAYQRQQGDNRKYSCRLHAIDSSPTLQDAAGLFLSPNAWCHVARMRYIHQMHYFSRLIAPVPAPAGQGVRASWANFGSPLLALTSGRVPVELEEQGELVEIEVELHEPLSP